MPANNKTSNTSRHSVNRSANLASKQRSYFIKNKYMSQSDMDLSRSSESRAHSADSTYSAATTSYRLKAKGKLKRICI
jgi:hypothetical protein